MLDSHKMLGLDESLEKNAGENANAEDLDNEEDNSTHEQMIESYGINQGDLDSIQRQSTEQDTLEDLRVISMSLQNVKADLHKLRQEQDMSLTNSISIDERLESVKVDMIELHRKISSSASVELLENVKQSMEVRCSRSEQNLEEYKSALTTQTNGRIDRDMANLKRWFGDLEELVKQRQTKLEQLVGSCAKEYDVTASHERIESDIVELTRNASFLNCVVKAQGRAFVALKKKMAISSVNKMLRGQQMKRLKRALQSWRHITSMTVRSKETQRSQMLLLNVTVSRIMSRRKRCALDRWRRYNEQHRKVERRKLKAAALIRDQLVALERKRKLLAFNQWRLKAIMDKVRATSSPNTYSVGKLVCSFNDDLQGASQLIAHEIDEIKTSQLPLLREEWIERNEQMSTSIHTNMNEAVGKVANELKLSSNAANKRIDECVDNLVQVGKKLQEHDDKFKKNQDDVDQLREAHREELDQAHAREVMLEERVSQLERQVHKSDEKLSSLHAEHDQSKESIKQLYEIIEKNEERHEYERQTLQAVMNHFGDELLKAKVSLGHTQVRCESLEKECSQTKSELDVFRRTAQMENEEIHDHIYHPGIKRPSLRRIIMVGNSYETLAKEKNYVTGINVTTTMISSPTSALYIDGGDTGQMRKEKVDLPAEITAFAHDYAWWISYQTDHESLTRMILEGSQDDQVYAEDDMLSRQKSLVEEVKIELGTELEHVTYPGEVTSESSTRGLGLRWEARAIFLSHLINAINAALTKHDQILLPAPTRLGRIRPMSANVSVCLACDRPMRRKQARPLSTNDERN